MTIQEAIDHLRLALEVNETNADHQNALARYHVDEVQQLVARTTEVNCRRAVMALHVALEALREKAARAELPGVGL